MTGSAFAIAPHEAVGLSLIEARVMPEHDPPAGYNDRRGRLWVRLLAHRTLPKSKEFEAEWRALHEMLTQAGAETSGHPSGPHSKRSTGPGVQRPTRGWWTHGTEPPSFLACI
jgi:hypothetical protein